MASFMVTADLAYEITSWDIVAETTFGYTADEARGAPLPEILCAKEFTAAVYAIFLEVRNGRVQWEGEMMSRRRNGELFHTHVKIMPISNPAGEMIGLTAVGTEMTELEVTEAPRVRFAQYLIQEKGLTPQTAYTYEQGLLRAERFLTKSADDMTFDDWRRFLRDSQYHPATKGATLIGLKAHHRWGIVEGRWERDDRKVELSAPKQVRIPLPALKPHEAAKLLEAATRPNEKKLIYLGLYAGTRITETASIGPGQWDEREAKLGFIGKGRKFREIPVHPCLATIRHEIVSAASSRNTLKQVMRSMSFYTGVACTSHSLRRTFAQSLRRARVQDSVIAALMGHAPISVLDAHYAPPTFDEMVEAILKLDYGKAS